ncbi:MAG TPA: hypothetical protein GX747_04245 [Tenericutes bacterium]|mgnify:CR=1 FL=1|nr:hypothetical protein [Mycoplasmatota bacterium]
MTQALDKLMTDIKEKYNYDDNFVSLLRKIIVGMILHYGEDKKDIIFDALLNTPIIKCKSGETIYDVLVKYGHYSDTEEGLVKAEDLKRASGVCSLDYAISYNEETQEYNIDNVDKMVVLSNYIDTEKRPSIIIHELGHLVKQYINNSFIKSNKLYIRSGLAESEIELSFDNGKVKKKLISEKGVGAEEGTNTYDEIKIMRSIFDKEYKSGTYAGVLCCANMLYDNLLLEKDIRDTQFYGNKIEFISAYDEICESQSYEKVEKKIDEIYELDLLAFSQIFDKEKLKETHTLINMKLDELIPELKKYYDKIQITK